MTDLSIFFVPIINPIYWMSKLKIDSRDIRIVKIFTMERQMLTFFSNYEVKHWFRYCSRKLWQGVKLDFRAKTNIAPENGWTNQASSQKGWRCGSYIRQELCEFVALQRGWARELLCSIRLFGKETQEGKIQQIVFVSYKLEELKNLMDKMRFVYASFKGDQSIRKFL